MLPKLQHNLTNWVDGMKINRQHFIDSENSLLDQIRDVHASSLFSFSYGLLQPLPGEKSSLECTVLNSQSGQFKISVSHCRAVTSGGNRIEILTGKHPELVSDSSLFSTSEGYEGKKTNAAAYLAVISVDPFDRLPFGVANADESPARNQYSVSTYKLHLIDEESVHAGSLGASHMPIARFTSRSGELVRDSNYIPPVAVIAAHPGTKQIYNSIAESLNQIQESSTEIIQKVVEQGQKDYLPLNLKSICEQCIWQISSEFFLYRVMYRQQSPVYVANVVVKLASVVNVSMNFMPAKDREEVLQYFNHWNEISPGKFQDMLATVINADYDHEYIYACFEPLLTFLKVWNDLLEKIKALKLIGQKKEGFDFGGRTREITKEAGKGKFNIMD